MVARWPKRWLGHVDTLAWRVATWHVVFRVMVLAGGEILVAAIPVDGGWRKDPLGRDAGKTAGQACFQVPVIPLVQWGEARLLA